MQLLRLLFLRVAMKQKPAASLAHSRLSAGSCFTAIRSKKVLYSRPISWQKSIILVLSTRYRELVLYSRPLQIWYLVCVRDFFFQEFPQKSVWTYCCFKYNKLESYSARVILSGRNLKKKNIRLQDSGQHKWKKTHQKKTHQKIQMEKTHTRNKWLMIQCTSIGHLNWVRNVHGHFIDFRMVMTLDVLQRPGIAVCTAS